jgi:molybdate transport system ATP-binding protein
VRIEGVPAIVAEVTASAATEIGLVPGSDVWVAVKATEIEVYPE